MRHIMLLIVLIAGGTLAVRAQNTNEGLIAFAADLDELDNIDIYVIDVTGGTPRRLTTSPAVDTLPAWSPDGSHIVFQSQINGIYDLFLMNKDGSDRTPLTTTPYNERGPQWSPDGMQIAFAADPETEGEHQIYLMDADGSNVRQLTDLPGNNTTVDWSPDGREIAFISGSVLMIMDVETRDVRRVHQDVSNLAWSPDGSRIAYNLANNSAWMGIAYYDLTLDRPGEFPHTLGGDSSPTWSPDGSRLAITTRNVNGLFGLSILDLSAGSRRDLLQAGEAEENFHPDWQPVPAN